MSLISILLSVTLVNAALPIAPSNIVCFPDRDFCTIEGYTEYSGKFLTLEILENGVTTGSASGIVSGGDIAFEINHPGALCWGDNTNLKVTPDIKAGNKVQIKSNNLVISDITILNGYITESNLQNNILTVVGIIGVEVNRNNLELRIVNPLFKDTAVARRDIRAITSQSNVPGYSSILTTNGNTFTATYTFTDLTAAQIAGNGEGQSLMMWQETDTNGNRQGLTIHERGEIGGPWSNLCPPSPENLDLKFPTNIIISGSNIKWNQVADKYRVTLSKTNKIYGFDLDINKVLFDLVTLDSGDKFEIRSRLDTKLSNTNIFTFTSNMIDPIITSEPLSGEANTVILGSNTGQILYTIDGTDPTFDNSLVYTGAINIESITTIKAIALDTSGRVSQIFTGLYEPIKQTTISPITGIQTVIENGGIKISWTPSSDPTLISYIVFIYQNNVEISNRETTQLNIFINDLTPGNTYEFSVAGKNNIGSGQQSIRTLPIVFPTPTDQITIIAARWRPTEFRVNGRGSEPATVTVHQVNSDNTIGLPLLTNNNQRVTGEIVCVNNECTYLIRILNNLRSNPRRIFVKSSLGGVAGPFNI